MKKSISVNCKFLFRQAFNEIESFMTLVEHFVAALPEYAPDRWNVVEPINKPFDLAAIRDAMPGEGFDFLWKRIAAPKGWGHFSKRARLLRGPRHAGHYLAVKVGRSGEQCLPRYLCETASRFAVDYAYCDTGAPKYVDFGLACQSAPYRSEILIPSLHLRRWLPDILWAQIFGPAYVRLFGMEKLLSAPAYKVVQLGPEMVYIQLSESLFDMHEKYEAVDEVRQRVKAHLDDNIFFRTENPEDHVYKAPLFDFADEVQ